MAHTAGEKNGDGSRSSPSGSSGSSRRKTISSDMVPSTRTSAGVGRRRDVAHRAGDVASTSAVSPGSHQDEDPPPMSPPPPKDDDPPPMSPPPPNDDPPALALEPKPVPTPTPAPKETALLRRRLACRDLRASS